MQDSQLKSKAFSGVFWKFCERMGAQTVSMVVSIVLARLLMPEDYSVVSIVAIFFSFCNIFITSGLGSGLVLARDVDEVDYSSALYFSLILAFIMYGAVFLLAPYVADLYNIDLLIPVIRVMGLNFFVYMTKSIVSVKVSRSLDFKLFFLSTLAGTVVSAIVGIVMALYGMGAWALVAQQSTNAVMDTVILIITTKIKFVPRFSFKRLKPLIRFSFKILITNFIGVIYEEIKPLIIGLKYSTIKLAYYNKAENFPRTISTSLDGTLSAVLFPTISRLREDKTAVLNCIRRFYKLSSYLIFPAMMGLMGITENFISVVLTDKWLPMTPFFKIHSIYYALYFITLGCGQIYKGIERTDVLFKLEVLKKLTSIAILTLFVLFSKNVIAFAWSSIIVLMLMLLIDSLTLKKLLDYKFQYQIKDLILNATTAFIMYLIVWQVGALSLNMYVELILQIVIGIIAYIALSIIFHNENFYYIWDLLSTYLKKLNKKRIR